MGSGLMSQRDARDVARALRKVGFCVTETGKHYHVEDGNMLYALAKTPSDRRFKQNAMAYLRRLGIVGKGFRA